MALVEVARFSSLQEAVIARSALEAMGFHPQVFDEYRANLIWTEQTALGGIRLVGPDFEASEARAFLGRPRRRMKSYPAIAQPPHLAALGYLAACALFGWPLAGFKRPDVFHKVTALVIIVMIASPFLLMRLLRG